MNWYQVTIVASDYVVILDVMAEDKDQAFEQALYKLINSQPKIDLFDFELQYEALFLEKVEGN